MKPTVISLFSILTACNSLLTDKTESIKLEKSTIDQLTKIELPLSSHCGASLTVYDQDSIQNFVSELPEHLRFGGLLKRTENFSAIILLNTYADEQIHYLTTVNRRGKIIEKFNLFSDGCHEDEFFWGQAKYTIDKDLKILQTDSSATYRRTEDGEIIGESVLSSSNRLEFYVDNDGKIKKHRLKQQLPKSDG
jgi:hypothetical protein